VILVDTSIWVDHLRAGEPALAQALEQGLVFMHPFVLGELACGNLQNRAEILHLLASLPAAPRATDTEALQFIENRRLMGRGVGYIDVHLLASAVLAGDVRFWTRDRRLAGIAGELRLALQEAPDSNGSG
jgi:predicted nucleic acid-binding protein